MSKGYQTRAPSHGKNVSRHREVRRAQHAAVMRSMAIQSRRHQRQSESNQPSDPKYDKPSLGFTAEDVHALFRDEPVSAQVCEDGSEARKPAEAFQLATSGPPRPVPYQQEMEVAFGTDFSHVQAFVGDPSAQTGLAAIDAQGAALGCQIAFAGENPSKELVAHELTHVVQAEGNPQMSDGMSHPSDVSEVKARAVAGRVAAGKPAGLVSPNKTSDNSLSRRTLLRDTRHVGGNAEDGIAVSSGSVLRPDELINPGEAGYSRRLLVELPDAVDTSISNGAIEELSLPNLLPSLDRLNEQRSARSHSRNRYQNLVNDHEGWAQEQYQLGLTFFNQQCADLLSHREDQEELFRNYNAWIPMGNALFPSLIRLQALMHANGITDLESMTTALVEQLSDAETVVAEGLLANARRSGVEHLHIPASDTTISDMLGEMVLATATLNAKYLGFRTTILDLEIQQTQAEGADERARLNEINRIKTTFRNIASTVDNTMTMVSAAPTAIANARPVVQAGEAALNAVRNRNALLDGADPRLPNHPTINWGYNTTHIATNDDGEMIIRDALTMMDDNVGSGQSTAAPDGGFSIPTPSFGTISSGLIDLVYSSEVEELQSELRRLEADIDDLEDRRELLVVRQKSEEFRIAMMAFGDLCGNLQDAFLRRRSQYLELGLRLDEVSTQMAEVDGQFAEADLAPEEGMERYATVLVLASQIQEILVVGNGAMNASRARNLSANQIEAFFFGMQEEREAAPVPGGLQQFFVGIDEQESLEALAHRMATYERGVAANNTAMEAVALQCESLISRFDISSEY